MLAETVSRTSSEASAARMALGPVAGSWTAETIQLERQLALLPLDVAAELAAQANRPTLRRMAGIAAAYATEGLIMLVLLVTIWRVGADFVAGVYASANLIFTVAALVAMLVLVGHTLMAMFFPPLRQRLRRSVGQRAKSLVKATMEKLQAALREHVAAVDRLARDGRELQAQIDRAAITLATETGADEAGDRTNVNRLFGQEPRLGLPPRSEVDEEAKAAQRRPVFD